MVRHSPSAEDRSLQRFIDAQQPVWKTARAELAAGSKVSHWMWFVLPQMKDLGRSPTARFYGIADRDEALAYWRHPLLGARLRDAIDLMLAVPAKSAHAILGSPDDLKFRSCLTLFEAVAPDDPRFEQALARFYDGERDPLTLDLLRSGSAAG
jgi:uncharacterized protein (DUF1810 family)